MRVLILLLSVVSASAQVLKVDAGASSLYGGNLAGGSVTAFYPTSTVTAGVIDQGGRVIPELSDSFRWRDDTVRVGSQTVGTVGVSGIGVSLQHDGDFSYGAFAGMMGLGYQLPYFAGYEPQHLGIGLFTQRKISGWTFSGLGAIAGGQKTGIGTVAYASPTLTVSAVGGELAKLPYASGMFSYRPIARLQVFGTHQDSYGTVAGHADGVGVNESIGMFSLNASTFVGRSAGIQTIGEVIGGGVRVSPISLNTEYFSTRSQKMWMTTLHEKMSRHFTVEQTITRTNGNVSFSGGGAYHSNHFIVSLDHDVVFIPFAGKGFQQETAVSLSFRIPHSDASATISNYVTAQGKMKYSAAVSEYARGSEPGHYQSRVTGKYIVRGIVKDRHGLVVEGAVIQIGNQIAISDSAGIIFTRTKTNHALTLQVRPEDFAVGNWRTVSAPESVTPAIEGQEQVFELIVEMF